MTLKNGIAFIICLTFCVSIYSQDAENDIKYDQEDLEFLFKSIGIDIYKYPFSSDSGESLNIIIEEYKNGQIVQNIDFYQQFLPMFKVLDKAPGDFFPGMSANAESWIKFYLKNQGGMLEAIVKTGLIEKKYSFDISELKFTQIKSFDSVSPNIDDRQALFAFYGITEGNLLSVSGDATVKDMLPLYNHVIVFYAEPFIIF